jgi:PAS domain S-box-containing protein
MAGLLASKDWAHTSIGPTPRWPSALRGVVDLMLRNRFPMLVLWGDQHVQTYNDAFSALLGDKHPLALGQAGAECWREVWNSIGPQIESVYRTGESIWDEDLPLALRRHGYIEETYFTFCYSAIPDPTAPNGIGGVLATVQEKTQKVIGERRLSLLRDLAALGSQAHRVDEECQFVAEIFASYQQIIPFSLIYLFDATQTTAKLVASSGVDNAELTVATTIDLTSSQSDPWKVAQVLRSGERYTINNLQRVLRKIPSGPWPEAPHKAVVIPIKCPATNEVCAVLICGVNRRAALDERYLEFFDLIAVQVAAAVGNASTIEREHQRAEALAEIDRAKITFFTNISHEFRTPLTLMLGPLEETLRHGDAAILPLVQTAHRNALRLLKLVNTLLDFSRFEAGRAEANFVETDLATLTRDLCSLFRSTIEGVGLTFIVNIDLHEPVFVDRSMWEKIVLNLLSNALKYTFEGQIRVQLTRTEMFAELSVTDTGVGIALEELPRIFERFHRIRGSRARTYEGTGIGLALVHELVQLHHGFIAVQSVLNEGSSFVVSLPFKARHQVGPDTDVNYLDIAQQYLADVQATISSNPTMLVEHEPSIKENRSRILVADDNNDLRQYVTRLLSPRYEVFTVANGVEALEALARQKFDLMISDVMMPQMDGFALLKAVRSDDKYAALPCILLSARAGEDSAIEGLTAGADDYLVKPFSAEEFLARVYAQLNAAAIRERAMKELKIGEERFRTLAASMPHIVVEANPDGAITYLSETYERYTGRTQGSGYGDGWSTSIHPDDRPLLLKMWQESLASGLAFREQFRMQRFDEHYRWHQAHILPQRDANGAIVRWTGTVTDIDEQRRAVQERDFLSNASRVLAQSLNLEQTLQTIAQLTVPEFADWCQIDLRTPHNELRTVAIAHRDPSKQILAQQFIGKTHLNPNAQFGTPLAIRSGQTNVIENISGILLDVVGDSTEVAIYEKLGSRTAVCIPLVNQGKTLGAIAVVYGESNRRYSREDIPMLEELGRRAALAVHNANQFEHEHKVAESFQEASLPVMLPQVSGLAFDAIYSPAIEDIQVGGDWYDAVQLFDGRIVISIGDVTGNGLGAAITMGNMRQIIRGIAQVHADPALMLDAADRALRLEHPDQLATAFVGVLDPITYSFAYASAGHPPPMLRFANGEVELLSDDGLPLGLRQGSTRSRGKKITIPDDSHLIFYTDGLTEYRRAPADGEERLMNLVGTKSWFTGPHPAAALKEAFLDGEPTMDDIAILIVSMNTRQRDSDTSQVQRWNFNVLDAKASQAARREFTEGLRKYGASSDAVHAAELVFGELLGNAARHAPGPVEVIADWTGQSPVLHVLDKGPGFTYVPALPRDVYAESGRGLYIISLLSDEFHVSRRLTVGSHARAVLSKN